MVLHSTRWLALSYFTYFFSYGIFLPFWSVWLSGLGLTPETIGMLLGAGLGYASYGNDVATAVGALMGFLLALGLARRLPARLPELLVGAAPVAPMTFSPAHDLPANAGEDAHGQPYNP